MTNGKPAKRPKGKPRGKPFTGKDDPRANKGGNLNAAAQSYEIRFRNALASGLAPEDFAAIVIEDVRRRRPGAKEFYADRLMGKVAQGVNLGGNGGDGGSIRIEVVHIGKDGGNGNGGNGGEKK